MTVRPSATSPDGFVCFSHAGDDFRACRDYVRAKLGLPADGWKTKDRAPARACGRTHARAGALAIWRASVEPSGTLAERYLRSRGLYLPDQIPEDEFLRWNPSIGAIVCLFRDVHNWTPRAVTRIYLGREGKKLSRAFLGPVGGAAVMLDAHGDIMDRLVVGEGVETCLAARQMGFAPVWALGSAGAIGKLPLLHVVQELIVLAEIDGGANANAVKEVTARWHADGRRVVVAHPQIGRDANDVLAGREVA
ncbi:toprim domain-containing protein [Rhodoblastus sp.]